MTRPLHILRSRIVAVGLCATLSACSGDISSATGPDRTDEGGETDGKGALGGTTAAVCTAEGKQVGERRIWRMTRAQYRNTVRDLLGIEPALDESFLPGVGGHGYTNEADSLRIRFDDAAQLQNAARTIAASAVAARLSALYPCGADKLGDATCTEGFVSDFGQRAFRRPLQSEEIARYVKLYELGRQKLDGAGGVQVVLEAMLQSPNFLFRSELGEGQGERVRLSAHEIATALSYFFLDSAPDAGLHQAAEEGKLETPKQIEAQARRLMALPEARPALLTFYRQWFEIEQLAQKTKDETLFPEFAVLRPDMMGEFDNFVSHVVFEADGKLETLLTAPYSFVTQGLGALYGVEVAGDGFVKTDLDPKQRAGLLTMSGVMSQLAIDQRTSPVARGRFVRDRLLCQVIPDPPPTVDLTVTKPAEGLTFRDELDARTSGGSCAGCHSLMNPVGFGFESLDAIGRHRGEDNGVAIDDSGELTGTRDIDGAFSGPVELAQRLAQSEQVQECVALQMFRYALGRAESKGDACAVVEVRDSFSENGHDLAELAIAMAKSDAFVYRKASE